MFGETWVFGLRKRGHIISTSARRTNQYHIVQCPYIEDVAQNQFAYILETERLLLPGSLETFLSILENTQIIQSFSDD